MIPIISLNIRGLGIDPKFITLKDFVFHSRAAIILIQETMHSKEDSITYFRKMLPNWFIAATEANGLSGGMATLWDPSLVRAKAYKCYAEIIISASIRGWNFPVNILNIYAPYKSRFAF